METCITPEAGPAPEELDAYMRLSLKDVARLVLCLLIEEELERRMAELLPRAERQAVS